MGVFLCAELSEEIFAIDLHQIGRKCYKMPYWDPQIPYIEEPIPGKFMNPNRKRSREAGVIGYDEDDTFNDDIQHLRSVASRNVSNNNGVASGSRVALNNQQECRCQLSQKMDMILYEFRRFDERFTRYEDDLKRMAERQE
ncbi:hypothetical protein PV326_008232 [Microctonus aethiopoides]|uniref:Uncharacterized protein n=1 Tax=Microctonus aethiopoides TaxID=144406 RepID=A0AA39FNC0_9HYME|nr:hypothetical protein PV326_008232 [Microctonus aethiopoides]KAK0172799.1 hypothetical protein PV328_006073 [Microctonus aethiopoides]